MNDYEMILATFLLLVLLVLVFFLKYYWSTIRNKELQNKILTLQKEMLELIKIDQETIRINGEMQGIIDRLSQSSAHYETEFKNLFEYMKAFAFMTTDRNGERMQLVMNKKTAVTRSMIEDGIVRIGTKTTFTLPAIKFTEETFAFEGDEEDTKKEGMS